MALASLFSTAAKKREQIVAIDLGGRTTKAVQLRSNGKLSISRYVLVDAPIYEKSPSAELLTEHFKAVWQELNTKTKNVAISLGVGDSLVRNAEMPPMPVGDMRHVLRNNTKNYLQQDLPAHAFDCLVIPSKPGAQVKGGEGGALSNKVRVLAAGARTQLVNDISTAAKRAGLIPETVVPGLVCPVNAFEAAVPEVYMGQSVALVDIGFKHSSICILREGDLILSRVVAIGGDRLTSGLAEALGISYAEAESIKLGIPGEVQAQLQALLLPLSRELRASIDFFEHQQDTALSQVYVSGGAARSEFVMQTLQAELMVECKVWNPAACLDSTLPPEQAQNLEQVAPQLAVAIGAALASF
jgi:type IV pilus assembly protein PilM